MSNVLARLLALLAAFQIQCALADDQNTTLCGQSEAYNSSTLPYSLNNNAWGDDGSGYSCMQVFDGGASFTVTYKWLGDASTVKGFPYARADPSNIPVPLANISSLRFAGKWKTYINGSENDSGMEEAEKMDDTALKVNAAIDMLIGPDPANATSIGPPFEIMVWPWYTSQILPLGRYESTPDIDTLEIAGMNYSLYHGFNLQGQEVFSWLAQQNITSVDADYAPLIKHIVDKGLLSGALWLGQLEFGSEIMHAAVDTVFEVTNYTLRLIRQGDPDDPHRYNGTSSHNSTATATVSQTSAKPSQTTSATTQAAASSTSNAASRLLNLCSLKSLSTMTGTPIILVVASAFWYILDEAL